MRNLLLNENNELHNRNIHISSIFDEKQDIESQKQDIRAGLSQHLQKQFDKLFVRFGNETVFGRSKVMSILNITASPASELIKKLLKANKIEPVSGFGKGKYRIK